MGDSDGSSVGYFHEFIPPESEIIAGKFDEQAEIVMELADKLNDIHANLDGSWEGNSANLFLDEYQPKIGAMRSFSKELRSKANQIRKIKVRIWVPG